MKLLFATLFGCLFALSATAQLNISYGSTNPSGGNSSRCMRIERGESGTFFVYSSYSASGDNFDGLSTGVTDKKRFLAAYDAMGKIKWVRGVSTEQGQNTELTCTGANVFFGSTIYSGSTIAFGPEKLTVSSPNSGVGAICQYDTLGNFVRAFTIGVTPGYTGLFDLKASPDGKLYALVTTGATGNYYGLNLPVSNAFPNSILLAVFDTQGNLQAIYPVGAMPTTVSYAKLSLADNGDILICFTNAGQESAFNGVTIPAGGSSISRWRPDGTNVWVKPVISTINECSIYNICGMADGNIGFVGTFGGALLEGFPKASGYHDALVGKMNGAGTILWSKSSKNPNVNYPVYSWGIAADAAGNIYLNGESKGMTFDDGAGCGNNGPYTTAFIARFNSDGTVGWAACESGGAGYDLIVQPDSTVFSVGTKVSFNGLFETTYLNHWRNPTLSIQPLKNKYCQDDTLSFQWKTAGISFPPNSYARLEVFQGNTTSSANLYIALVSGSSGVIKYPLTSSAFPNAPVHDISMALKIGGLTAPRSTPFTVANRPIPYFADETKQVCYNGDHWLKPVLQNNPPDLVTWTPKAGLLPSDSIVALAQKVKSAITYHVTYTNTADQCSATDSIRLIPYNFNVQISGPEEILQSGNNTYNAIKSGNSPFQPFQYQWYKDGVAGSKTNQFYTLINDTTLLNVVMTDKDGCTRTDSLLVYFYPPLVLKGSVVNHDSTAPMPSTKVYLWYLDNTSFNPTPKVTTTDAAGKFSFNTAGNNLILIQAVPDTLQYPEEAPAWYTRKYFAQNADLIWLTEKTTVLEPIRLFSPKMLPDSNGILGGQIDETFFTSGGPAAGLPIWIAGPDLQPLRYTVTDQNGYFRFDKLPFGDFYFLVDKWGIRNDLAPKVSLNALSPQKTKIIGTLLADRLVLSNIVNTSTPEDAGTLLRISPNPTTGQFGIHAPNRSGWIEVFDAAGLVILRKNVSDSDAGTQVDLHAWPAGIYWVRWSDGTVVKTARVVKE